MPKIIKGEKAIKAEKKAVQRTVDPFAEIVEAPSVRKEVVKKVKEPATSPKKPVRKARKKAPAVKADDGSNVASSDPFAESVTQLPVVKSKSTRTSKSAASDSKVKKTSRKAAKKTVETADVVTSEPLRDTAVVNHDVTADIASSDPEVELSPVFKTLAAVELPKLERKNRAQLLMQSPTRLYLYWSVGEDPWQKLRSVFGSDLGSYTLVLKLVDLKRDTEEIHRAEGEGDYWFNVEPNGIYQAEIGFYAPNRPYFRIIYSNSVATPRRNPSPRPASEAQWSLSADKFAEVLDVAGFTRDAYDVAIAGDDHNSAQDAAHIAFSSFVGDDQINLNSIAAEDLRYAMFALASGATLEDMRWRVGPALFAILQANVEKLSGDNARAVLSEHFDIDEAEWSEEQFGSAVYGASLINFPRTLKSRKISSRLSERYSPVSSHSLR